MSDHLASLRVAIEGGVTRRIDYDPWGNVISGGAAASERLTFNAQERDLESGLYDVTDRNLDGALGAFTRPDRLWEKFPSWSPYHYAYADPMRFTDPNGMQSLSWLPINKFWMGFAGAVIGTGLGYQASKSIDALLKQPGGLTTTAPAPGEVKYPVRILPHAPPDIQIPNQRQLVNPPPPIIVNADGDASEKASEKEARDYKFPGKQKLAEELGTTVDDYHDNIKPDIKQDLEKYLRKLGSTNPDIGYDKTDRNIVLKHPSTGRTIKTDISIDAYTK